MKKRKLLSIILTVTMILTLMTGTNVFASTVDCAVVDVTMQFDSITLAEGASTPIFIKATISGNQVGTATFQIYQDWTLINGVFTGSNPVTIPVPPRAAGGSYDLYIQGTITVSNTDEGTYTLVATAFNIYNSNSTGAKLSAGKNSECDVIVENPGPITATVTLGNLTATYDGTPKAVTVTTSPVEGLACDVTYNGLSTAPTDAGSYAVVATITDPNYTGSTTGTLTIAKAPATVTLSDLNPTYDGTPKAVTVATSVPGLTCDVTYNGSSTAPTDAGSYAVVATINDPNYTGSTSGTLTIDKADAIISVIGYNGVYDANPHGAMGTATGVGGVDLSSSLSLGQSYTNVPGGTAHWTFSHPNYNDQSGDVSINISKAASTTTINIDDVIIYGNPVVATAHVTGAGIIDETNLVITYTGTGSTNYPESTTPPTNAGTYIAKATFAGDDNHTGSFVTKEFSIIYNFTGFLQPLNATGPKSVYKLGSVVPVKFQLTDANGNYVSTAVANITLKSTVKGSNQVINESENATSAANSGTLFRYDSTSNLYIYNLSTKPLSVAYDWSITVTLNDGTTHSVSLGLK